MAPPLVISVTGTLQRRIVPITGGRFDGPVLHARVVPGGADWQIDDGEGVLNLTARYTIETDDGVTISVVNRGLRRAERQVMARISAGEAVAPDDYYFRTSPTFDAPAGPYAWLRESLFVAAGEREPAAVVFRIFRCR